MVTCIGKVLTQQQVQMLRRMLAEAEFADGRLTAGPYGQDVKNNLQLKAGDTRHRAASGLVLEALGRSAVFSRAAMPKAVVVPTFNRYEVGMTYGRHVDSPIIANARADLSVTVFLSDLDSYEGGELCVEADLDVRRVKLPAGDAVLYPANQLHWVEPVTRGIRLAAITWVQSMIRDSAMRQVVSDVAAVMGQLYEADPASDAARILNKAYANLMRLVVET